MFLQKLRYLLIAHLPEANLTSDEKKYLDILKAWNRKNDNEETGFHYFYNLV